MITESQKEIKLALSTDCLELKLRSYVMWNYHSFPSLLVLGNTGSGKSYALRQVGARISKAIPNSKAWICCFKNEFMQNPPENSRFFGHKSVIDGFTEFEKMFYDRLYNNHDNSFRLLLIDEYISWLNSMEKKEADEIKKRMANLLFMIRSKNCHIILGCQRGMAESFNFGSRDCLNVVFLGSPSKESIGSFVNSDDAEKMKPKGIGNGYVLFDDGLPPKAITFPLINTAKVNKLLNDIVTR